jgi:Mor family transcriptional regulator
MTFTDNLLLFQQELHTQSDEKKNLWLEKLNFNTAQVLYMNMDKTEIKESKKKSLLIILTFDYTDGVSSLTT